MLLTPCLVFLSCRLFWVRKDRQRVYREDRKIYWHIPWQLHCYCRHLGRFQRKLHSSETCRSREIVFCVSLDLQSSSPVLFESRSWRDSLLSSILQQEEFHSQKLNVPLVHEIDKDILTTNISCICFCSKKSVSRVKREEILTSLFLLLFHSQNFSPLYWKSLPPSWCPKCNLWMRVKWVKTERQEEEVSTTHTSTESYKRILQTDSFLCFWRQRPSHRETSTTGSDEDHQLKW